MAMSEPERPELFATKPGSSRGQWTIRMWFAVLAAFVCAAALVPSVYVLVSIVESLPHLSLTQDGSPDHIDLR
jgi:hypothetical protein